MKIVSFIDESLLIRCILEYLNLWQERIPRGLPPPEHQEEIVDAVVCEAFDDGWGRYEETDSTLH
ncbi:MAG: hypothetical protein C0614_13535 [Desulfuromonas sp.]|nr:MAG: hypothetical protein C0614_13535 [Desulfuromonas sp.]